MTGPVAPEIQGWCFAPVREGFQKLGEDKGFKYLSPRGMIDKVPWVAHSQEMTGQDVQSVKLKVILSISKDYAGGPPLLNPSAQGVPGEYPEGSILFLAVFV